MEDLRRIRRVFQRGQWVSLLGYKQKNQRRYEEAELRLRGDCNKLEN